MVFAPDQHGGSFNTATDAGTLLFNLGNNSTAVKAAALLSKTDGSGNTAVGLNALENANGNNNAASPSDGGLEMGKFATGRIRCGRPAPQVVIPKNPVSHAHVEYSGADASWAYGSGAATLALRLLRKSAFLQFESTIRAAEHPEDCGGREITLDNCRGSSKSLVDFVIRQFHLIFGTAE